MAHTATDSGTPLSLRAKSEPDYQRRRRQHFQCRRGEHRRRHRICPQWLRRLAVRDGGGRSFHNIHLVFAGWMSPTIAGLLIHLRSVGYSGARPFRSSARVVLAATYHRLVVILARAGVSSARQDFPSRATVALNVHPYLLRGYAVHTHLVGSKFLLKEHELRSSES